MKDPILDFKKYDLAEIQLFLPYFKNEEVHSCDYSLGAKYMWKKYYRSEYVIYNDTLTFKETYGDNRYSFFYPMGKDKEGLFKELKKYSIANLNQCLEFCCVDETKLSDLKKRFPHYETNFDRGWSDYLYLNQKFQDFSGGEYSNKRHHVKQFNKLYPEALFKVANVNDKERLVNFIKEYSKTIGELTSEEEYELCESIKTIENFDLLSLDVFYVEYKGEIIALSVCEVINDCVYDHIEKGLRQYQSIYPFLVNKIANYYKDITYFNREEDINDPGLRFSKEDYHPYKMVTKNMFYVRNNLDLICKIPTIKVNEEISLSELSSDDKDDFLKLNLDEELNKLWGYDYHKDLNNKVADGDYFYNVNKDDFKKKTCLTFIIKRNNKLIGDITLENLDNNNSAEIGFRLIKSEQGKGIAYNSLSKLLEYLKNEIKLRSLRAKAYKNNLSSIHLIEKLNFKAIKDDDNFNYYELVLNKTII